jgi:hypothetical protein
VLAGNRLFQCAERQGLAGNCLFQCAERQVLAGNRLFPTTAEVKNEWRCSCTPPMWLYLLLFIYMTILRQICV